MGILSFFRRPPKPDLDGLVLTQLRKAGSILSKPHKIDFFLYLPTQHAAEQIASNIQKSGFRVKVEKAAKGDQWLCFANKTMVPELSVLQKIRQDFTSVTSALQGKYDGWGTEVEK